jgi:DNA polymerase III subunit alpha
MSSRSFVHLHCHSHYSLLDGANRIPELVAQTKKLGMNAVALTDHGNLYGAVELYREAGAVGINPIIGYEAYVAPRGLGEKSASRKDAATHLTLLAKNTTGFKNLIKLASAAFLDGFRFVPRIDKDLLTARSEGIICLSGCLSGEFNELLLRDNPDEAEALAAWYAKLFGKDFYIEIQNNGLEIQDACTEAAVRIARKMGIALVATADAHYLCQEDALAHDVLICINTGAKRSDEKRMRYGEGSRFPNPYFVRSPEDMYRLFEGLEDAVQRSQEIADGVHIDIDFTKRHFPVFTPPDKKKPEDYLRELCQAGLRERYGDPPPEAALRRLEHELDIICRMGFASYFLIVWDFVRFARESGIPATARGSGCGAIVSYVLKISHVCPLEYDLLFERFLDPSRNEPPDIDIDFCQDRREQVIAYVKQKYGEQSVAQIGTFGTLAAKAAIKDVGRVLDIPLDRVNQMNKLVPMRGAISASLDEALAESPDFRREYETDPQVREWIDIARRLEGTNRNAATHAAGVVIANGLITDYVPVQRIARRGNGSELPSRADFKSDPVITTQWVMGDVERIGLLKMDFLGLRTLTLLDNTLRLIEKTRREQIDLHKLPLDDAETYKMLQRGDAKGVFQFEKEGFRELLKRLKPDNIRDIIACTALYRPGPLEGGMIDEYIDCKHGRRRAAYPHSIMEELLAETHGVMVYQEQVMRILNRLGGIELSSAYACIKAISKKKEEIIDARKIDFIKGAKEHGLTREKAEEIFELIVKFGGYGFNKSHSAAYAHVSYHTAYLKRHYTPEFMAALLSSEIDDGNKRDIMVEHIADARKFGVDVLPPDVNSGEADFAVVDGKIAFGLTAIKGVGRGAAEEIVRARQEKDAFQGLYDFCERVDHRIVNKTAMERLIKAGALDACAGPSGHRAQLLAALPAAMQQAAERQQDRRRGQMSFFDVLEGSVGEDGGLANDVPLPEVPRWVNIEHLKFEKEALDFYFSSHPLAEFDADLRRYASHEVQQLRELEHNAEARIGGMISQVRLMTTKRGDRFVRCKIADFTGQAECVMWPSDFARYKDCFVDDRIFLVEAIVDWQGRGDEPVLQLRKVLTIEQAKKDLTRGLVLRMVLGQHSAEVIDGVARVLKRSQGPCPVFMQVRDGAGRRAHFRLGDDFKVHPAEVKVEELEMLLGPGSVVFSGR